ncbi:MAG: GTP-binding protein [Candidatus Scalindua sp.]|jgi:small GTP-binding protein|nr:GTP-binding protein [Candidatus Scalindua sp.]MBT5305024.1 GTP-binding protein [Candidatus Scalindua sp.]MBT6564667.1 GTP-binding protein [Candidatus Scalindua sp.]MBT7212040.1 GTP-binding protein [Candidatus Scalindua sp.]MBT7589472.1 GTP-binding protein [Candidatus Scalindua sp.]
MLEEFINHKSDILGVVADINSLQKENNKAGNERLIAVREQLISNHFNLVVLGQFKRGKTTLINSLVGNEILPSSVVPLTSIVTILKFGNEVKCTIFLNDGTEQDVQLEEIHDYVTESGNPENRRGVKCACIEYPIPLLEKGMQLVDTPGIGSTFLHNTETTYEFLDHLDAAVFLMSADVPISQVEKELLETIKSSTQKIFFVLNKVDNLIPKEIEEMSAYNNNVLKEMGFTVQEIWPISARKALEGKTSKDEELLLQSGLSDLEDAIGNFLASEKGKIVLNTAISKLKRITLQIQSQIAIETKTLTDSEEELENKISTFHKLNANLKKDKEDIAYLIKGETIKLNKKVEEMLKDFEEPETARIRNCLQSFNEDNNNAKPTALKDDMQKMIKAEIVKGFDAFKEDVEPVISDSIQETFNRFTKRSNDIIQEFKTAAEQLFEVPMQQSEFTIDLAEDKRFYYMVQESMSMTEEEVKSILRTFMPKSISRKMVLKEMIDFVASEVGRNCGRTRSSLATRIGSTFKQYTKEISNLGNELIENIEQAMQKGKDIRKDSAESIQNELTTLSTTSGKLDENMKKLEGVWNEINNT